MRTAILTLGVALLTTAAARGGEMKLSPIAKALRDKIGA